MNELKRLRKAYYFRGLPDLSGSRKQRPEEELPLLPIGLNDEADTTTEWEKDLARALKDDTLTKRITSMKNGKYPYGTVPELIMVDYLEEQRERYKYQAQLYGGWRSGGLIPDFVVSRSGVSRALLINGNYWHNTPGKREKDASDKIRIMNSYFEGELITSVVIVWESRLMAPDRRQVMASALAGQETPP